MKSRMKWACIVIFLASCASPRVWIISEEIDGGIIGYQNYNPAKDNGLRIKSLLQCKDHRLTANPIKQGYSQPTGYSVINNGYGYGSVVPWDGGAYEWGEYHYRCNSKPLQLSDSQRSIPTSSDPDFCIKNCEIDVRQGNFANGMTQIECVARFCK